MAFSQIASKLSPRGWAMVGGSAAVAILFLYFVFQMASAPSYSTLMTGVDPAQTGKITASLASSGIGYEIQNGGTAIAVQSDKTSQARVALAGAGLLSDQQPGFSLFDKSQLGSSNFQQQIMYQRALQGELATTIQSIQGVSGAQVELVLPSAQDQLFADNTTPASAAVLLTDSGQLDSSSVRGIAQLVASSVPNLSLDKVTITDGTGAMLWPTSGAIDSAGGGGSLLAKQSAQASYDSQEEATVNAMLASTLGPGKAEVQINADLNANQATSDTLTYAKKGVPLTQHLETEKLTGTGGSAGTAGTTGNVPAYAATGNGTSNYNHQITDTTYGIDKTVTHGVIAPGAITSQSVAVLVSQTVPAAQLAAVKAAVASAVGINAKRGDTLTIGQIPFTATTTTPTATPMPIMTYAKYGLAGLGSLIFLFFVTRMLRRREREDFAGQPTWLRELSSAPRPLAALGSAEQDTKIAQLRGPVNIPKRQIADLVERDPDRVAQQVRAWMSED
jgi:flagellar M-ring protein FliF